MSDRIPVEGVDIEGIERIYCLGGFVIGTRQPTVLYAGYCTGCRLHMSGESVATAKEAEQKLREKAASHMPKCSVRIS